MVDILVAKLAGASFSSSHQAGLPHTALWVQHCARDTLPAEHARYATVPVENLHRVPDNVTDQEACFTEPLAAACRIVEQKVARARLMHHH